MVELPVIIILVPY